MIDMKLTKKEAKEKTYPVVQPEGPEYPYGLMITLDKDSLGKLKIDVDKCSVGNEFVLTAKCRVVGISSRQSFGNGGDYESVEIQITKMQLEAK